MTSPDPTGAADSITGSAPTAVAVISPRPAGQGEADLCELDVEVVTPPGGPVTDLIAALVPLLLGIPALLYSISLGLGTPTDPGAGMWPAVCCGVLLIAAIVALVRRKVTESCERFGRRTLDIGLGGLSIGVFIMLFTGIGSWAGAGMEFSFLALVAFWVKVLGRESWVTTAVISVSCTVVLHLIFIELLAAPIPHVFGIG